MPASAVALQGFGRFSGFFFYFIGCHGFMLLVVRRVLSCSINPLSAPLTPPALQGFGMSRVGKRVGRQVCFGIRGVSGGLVDVAVVAAITTASLVGEVVLVAAVVCSLCSCSCSSSSRS